MSEKEFNVKQLTVTIQRGKHNKENPYVMISKKMLRDKSLSPKAKGVLCYLLILPDTWQAHPKEVAKSMGVSKDQIYTVLSELLKSGYAFKREIKGEKGRFGNVIYEFYEEKLPEEERFKEKSTVSAFPDTGSPDTETPPIVNTYLNENGLEENTLSSPSEESAVASEDDVSSSKPKRSRAPSVFSPKVKEVADKMINILHKENPVYRVPENLEKFLENVQSMLEKDKQDANNLLRAFEWACKDNEERNGFKGWQSIICTNKRKGKVSNPAEIFRGHFSTIYAQMKSKPKGFGQTPTEDFEGSQRQRRWEEGAL